MIAPELVIMLSLTVRDSPAYRFLTSKGRETSGLEMIRTAAAFLLLSDEDGRRLYAYVEACGDRPTRNDERVWQ